MPLAAALRLLGLALREKPNPQETETEGMAECMIKVFAHCRLFFPPVIRSLETNLPLRSGVHRTKEECEMIGLMMLFQNSGNRLAFVLLEAERICGESSKHRHN